MPPIVPPIQRALLSVTDKSGLAEFARRLAALQIELISTGGTARLLRDAGLAVRDISDLTGFPEMLDGRVKTLHPRVHGGILHIRSNPEHVRQIGEQQIVPIDMVVVNLYAFEKAAAKFAAGGVEFQELIENIDIGGPSMVRSAAKNFADVAIVTSPADYSAIADELERWGGTLSLETRWRLAQQAFATTAAYDAAIASALEQIALRDGHFQPAADDFPATLRLSFRKAMPLRYGENPHQRAALYKQWPGDGSGRGVANGRQLQGKELSYNNIVDLDAAWELTREFATAAPVSGHEFAAEAPVSGHDFSRAEESDKKDGALAPAFCGIIKHTNPCGAATGASLLEAYRKALEADPVSAFGGVIGFNREIDGEAAAEIAKLFVEAIAAPGFSPEARAAFAAKKNLRLVEISPAPPVSVLKNVSGGLLLQDPDWRPLTPADLKVVTKRPPSDAELRALLFAWKICKHVKSNAIVYAREGQTVGIGAGQMSRVDSTKIGAMKAALPLAGTVAASDAFFPFPDGVEEIARAGSTAIIQPGGSMRDNEVIAVADRLGLAMVLTGIRHFRH